MVLEDAPIAVEEVVDAPVVAVVCQLLDVTRWESAPVLPSTTIMDTIMDTIIRTSWLLPGSLLEVTTLLLVPNKRSKLITLHIRLAMEVTLHILHTKRTLVMAKSCTNTATIKVFLSQTLLTIGDD